MPKGPEARLRRPPELGPLKPGDLGVSIRLSAETSDECASSVVDGGWAARFAICGKVDAAGRAGDDGRPRFVACSVGYGLCTSWCEGLRMLCTPNGLEGGGSANNGGNLLAAVTESKGRSVLPGGPAGG